MSLTNVPFKREHWYAIEEQPGLIDFSPTAKQLEVYEAAPWGVTVFSGERAIFCGGIIPLWPNRGEAWARLSYECLQEFAGLHRIVRRVLFEKCTLRRIESVVELNFAAGHRWMRLLGFTRETEDCMRHYYPDGRHCVLYSLIRKEKA